MSAGSIERSALAAFLGVKLMVLAYAALAWPIVRDQPIESGWELVDSWNRWDAPHYVAIARDGYQTVGDAANFIVFFPLYPWLIRVVARVAQDHVLAAFLVSTAASLVAAVLLARLGERELGRDTALRSVWALALFPTAYFLHIGYSESLFLALVLGTFLAAREGAWLGAGALGFAAALTRSSGIVLIPALAVEAWSQWREGRRSRLAVLAIAMPALGLGAYLAVNFAVWGDPLRFLEIQRHNWHKQLAPPWVGLIGMWQAFERGPSEAAMLGGQELLFALVGLAGVAAAASRLRPAYAVWMAGNWLLFVGTSWVMSVPRYTLALFPLYWLFALAGERRLAGTLLVVGSVLLQALFALRFSLGYWSF